MNPLDMLPPTNTTPQPKLLAWDTAVLMLCGGMYARVKVIDCDCPSQLRPIIMEREYLMELMRERGCCKAGSDATRRGFGLQMMGAVQAGDVVFIETRKA